MVPGKHKRTYSMKLYLVPPGIGIIAELIKRFDPKPNVLLSYARVSHDFGNFIHTYRPKLGKLMLDSGAYSEMKDTMKIDLGSYTAFLKGAGHLFDYTINLDVEPENYDVRMWNLAKLRKVCPNILPVVHDPYSGEIDQLFGDGYHYILIGSSDGRNRAQQDFIFDRYVYSNRFPGLRLHKLGTTSYNTFSEYPYYSGDSTSFVAAGGVGQVMYWNEHREPDLNGNHTDTIYFGGYDFEDTGHCQVYYNYPYIAKFEDYIWKTFEYRLPDLEGPPGAMKRWVVNGKYTLDLQERLTRLHGG